MSNNGIPGVGGSLGTCAVCGRNFLADIMLGNRVTTFSPHSVVGMMAAHNKCADEYLTKPVMEWPIESPLRKAMEEHNTKLT